MRALGVEDIEEHVSAFFNCAVKILKTRCIAADCNIDEAALLSCVHKTLVDDYLQCLRLMFGRYNTKLYIFATADNSAAFSQVMDVPVLVANEAGDLFMQNPTAAQVEYARAGGNDEAEEKEATEMKTRIKGVKFCYRRFG